MTSAIDKLKEPPPPMMVPGCSTCRHLQNKEKANASLYWNCGAQGGRPTAPAYGDAWGKCQGTYWEPMPPHVPVLVRFKQWLIG